MSCGRWRGGLYPRWREWSAHRPWRHSALTDALRRVLTDPAERARLAAAGLAECRRSIRGRPWGGRSWTSMRRWPAAAPIGIGRWRCRRRRAGSGRNRTCCRCRLPSSFPHIWTTPSSPPAALLGCCRPGVGHGARHRIHPLGRPSGGGLRWPASSTRDWPLTWTTWRCAGPRRGGRPHARLHGGSVARPAGGAASRLPLCRRVVRDRPPG